MTAVDKSRIGTVCSICDGIVADPCLCKCCAVDAPISHIATPALEAKEAQDGR